MGRVLLRMVVSKTKDEEEKDSENKTEGLNEIAGDMEAGPEDKTEDNPEVKNVEMAKSINDYGFGGPRKGSPIGKDDWGTPRSSDWGRPCSPTHYTWAPKS